jgi:hypothetical protein
MKSLNLFDSEKAAVVASATLSTGDPDPLVRYTIVSKARPGSELYARRVLWAAVNDESEWVRAASYLSLIDSPIAEFREQALRGVRVDSVAVKLALLRAMERDPKDHYRSALRFAVVDSQAVVRALALRAFAVQSGEVALAEIQNTLNDPSPLVHSALVYLAAKKGLQLPPQP